MASPFRSALQRGRSAGSGVLPKGVRAPNAGARQASQGGAAAITAAAKQRGLATAGAPMTSGPVKSPGPGADTVHGGNSPNGKPLNPPAPGPNAGQEKMKELFK